jgi:hypothetical protein
MLHGSVRASVVAVMLAGALLATSFSTGPPTSRTGAPAVGGVAAEGVCTLCHTTFPLNANGATLEILDVPEFYLPDSVYTLRVRLSSTFTPPRRWGFQLTAVRAANGQGAGTFDIAGSTLLQILSGSGAFASRRYVEHTSSGTFPNDDGPIVWTFRWRAPNANQGRIHFFAAGNAANNSGSNSGDHIYTQRDSADIHPLLDAPHVPVATFDELSAPRPNPFRFSTTLGFSLARAGRLEITVLDSQGRSVRTILTGERPAGPGTVTWDGRRDDGGAAAPGVYWARLVASGSPEPVSRRVLLTR